MVIQIVCIITAGLDIELLRGLTFPVLPSKPFNPALRFRTSFLAGVKGMTVRTDFNCKVTFAR